MAVKVEGPPWKEGMDCPTCEAMVDAYADGELTATER